MVITSSLTLFGQSNVVITSSFSFFGQSNVVITSSLTLFGQSNVVITSSFFFRPIQCGYNKFLNSFRPIQCGYNKFLQFFRPIQCLCVVIGAHFASMPNVVLRHPIIRGSSLSPAEPILHPTKPTTLLNRKLQRCNQPFRRMVLLLTTVTLASLFLAQFFFLFFLVFWFCSFLLGGGLRNAVSF